MRNKKIIVANWKMNPRTEKEAEKLLSLVKKMLPKQKKVEVVIAPPFIYISKLRVSARNINFAAQNAYLVEKGPYTGEVSPFMLEDIGVKYVILGHSERRVLGEDDALINRKIKAAISSGLLPILCVGEKVRDQEHAYFDEVRNQLKECLKGISNSLVQKITVAYEPVWAISSTPDRRDATPADCLEMVIFIRKVLSDLSSPKVAGVMRLIYGGSVDDRDAEGFLREGGAEGLLVGKASLDAKKFSKIVEIAEKI